MPQELTAMSPNEKPILIMLIDTVRTANDPAIRQRAVEQLCDRIEKAVLSPHVPAVAPVPIGPNDESVARTAQGMMAAADSPGVVATFDQLSPESQKTMVEWAAFYRVATVRAATGE